MINRRIPHQEPNFRLEEIDGEMLLYHPGQTKIMYCNPSASLIWRLCNGQRTVADIIALLQAVYAGADTTAIAADVGATLDLLGQHGAISYQPRWE